MSDELKKCPFCGSELVIYHSAGDVTVVRCGDCGARVDAPMGLYRNAHAAWNTRPLEDALQARIDDLEGEIELKRITLDSSVLANKELEQRIAELGLLETRLREMKLGWIVDRLHDIKPVYKGVNVRYAPEVLSPDELRLWNQRIADED